MPSADSFRKIHLAANKFLSLAGYRFLKAATSSDEIFVFLPRRDGSIGRPRGQSGRFFTVIFPPMFYAYVLKSLKDGRYYYGHTADTEKRLEMHNKGLVKSTKNRRPFVLHYTEEFQTKKEATQREYFFKTIDGYNFLKQKKII